MFTLNCGGRLVCIPQAAVMGILNITPDSFFAGSRFSGVDDLLRMAENMLEEGATFLDIGGQSTRPGSTIAGEQEELQRVIPAMVALCRRFPDALVSVDTYYARVARESVAAGALMVNDISGGSADPAMIATVAGLQVPYVCMHVKGSPATMHRPVAYPNIVTNQLDYFSGRLEQCRLAGIHDVIVDPGFGFSKNIAQNFQLLRHLELLKMLGKPVLVGLSRKSTVYKTLGTTPDQALNGSTVLHTIGLLHGADILRVHDVKEAVEAVKMVSAYSAAASAGGIS